MKYIIYSKIPTEEKNTNCALNNKNFNWDQKYFSGHHTSISKDISKVFLRKPHKECNLNPECSMKDEQECEIKDIVVSVQVQE